jgi:hypothetical protein
MDTAKCAAVLENIGQPFASKRNPPTQLILCNYLLFRPAFHIFAATILLPLRSTKIMKIDRSGSVKFLSRLAGQSGIAT